MAEDNSATAPVEEKKTDVTEAPTETATESNDTKDETAPATKSEDNDAKLTKEDVAIAGEQATTEVNAPDGEGKTEVEEAPTNGTDATPGSSKGKRKSSSGVPEHKTKKLQKKKSQANLNLEAKEGEFFWARLKGFPPWPSVICDEEMLPVSLLGNRPVSAKRTDGSYREDFLPEGKNVRDRTYAVMFLGTNEFAWLVNTNLTKLEPGDCSPDKVTSKMVKKLREAYEVADDRPDLDHFKKILADHQEEVKAYEEATAAKEAEKEAKAAKKAEADEKAAAEKKDTKAKKEKRKSKSKENVSGDEMDVDAPDAAEAKPSKKRKKEAESEGEGPKPKKTPKSIKINAGKTPNGDSTKKPARTKKTVSKPDGKEEEKEIMTEEQRRERRQKAVLYLRHKLQKGFLTRDQAPKEEEMADMASHFNQLEEYANLEAAIIRETKIHKVLKAIVKLASIPQEAEHKFKERSNKLLTQWNKALDANSDNATGTTAAAPDTPAANGDATAAASEEPTKEPSAAPVETTEPGNDAKDEADGDLTMVDAKDDKPEEAEKPAAEETTETAAAAEEAEPASST